MADFRLGVFLCAHPQLVARALTLQYAHIAMYVHNETRCKLEVDKEASQDKRVGW